MKSYSVTIIVPIYNVEKYIERCAVSLFEQDFDDIEYIFVNDCTPDNSMQILKSVLERYPNRQSHAKIINHKINKGLGYTRKTGLKEASGEYIIHIDSDDWVELDMISSMYKEAKSKDLDILICDYYLEYEDKSVLVKQIPENDLLAGIIAWRIDNSLANKLVKKSIYTENGIYPPENISMAEDRHLMIRLVYNTSKIGFLNRAFFHYRKNNPTSLTAQFTERSLKEYELFLIDVESFLKDKQIFYTYKEEFLVLLREQYKMFYDNRNLFLYERYGEFMTLNLVKQSFKSPYYKINNRRKFKMMFWHLKMKFKYLFNK